LHVQRQWEKSGTAKIRWKMYRYIVLLSGIRSKILGEEREKGLGRLDPFQLHEKEWKKQKMHTTQKENKVGVQVNSFLF